MIKEDRDKLRKLIRKEVRKSLNEDKFNTPALFDAIKESDKTTSSMITWIKLNMKSLPRDDTATIAIINNKLKAINKLQNKISSMMGDLVRVLQKYE